jgi:alpha-glucosidase
MSDWWRGAVTYQVYPRSFQDSNGDGVGDLPGITRRLPYLAESWGGCRLALALSSSSPMKDMGYDVSDYCEVDPVFGTLADFDALIARAHDLGLKVIIDQVLSHTSDQHPVLRGSAASDRLNDKADWYVWADARNTTALPPCNWLSVFGGSCLAMGCAPEAILPAQLPDLAARPELPQSRRSGLGAGQHALLAGAGGGRVPLRHGELLLPRPPLPRQPRRLPGEDGTRGQPLCDAVSPVLEEPARRTSLWMERIRTLLDEYGAAFCGRDGRRRITRSG